MAKDLLVGPRAWTAEIIRKARDAVGTPEALALALKKLGLVSARAGGEPYSVQTVNNWARGDFTPDADVLLAAARIGSVKVDAILYGESIVERLDRLEGQVRELLEEVRAAK